MLISVKCHACVQQRDLVAQPVFTNLSVLTCRAVCSLGVGHQQSICPIPKRAFLRLAVLGLGSDSHEQTPSGDVRVTNVARCGYERQRYLVAFTVSRPEEDHCLLNSSGHKRDG